MSEEEVCVPRHSRVVVGGVILGDYCTCLKMFYKRRHSGMKEEDMAKTPKRVKPLTYLLISNHYSVYYKTLRY